MNILKKLFPITDRDLQIFFLFILIFLMLALPYNFPLDIDQIYLVFGILAASSIFVANGIFIRFLNRLAKKLERLDQK